MSRALPALAALNGLLAVAGGAIGAHMIQDAQAKGWIATGSTFGLAHAAAALAVLPRHRLAAWAMTAGALLFSVSLYARALHLPPELNALAPIGGVTMLAGWATLAIGSLRR